MRTLTIRGLRAHPVRFVATMLAVIVSTGFLATAVILRDSVAGTLEANTLAGLAGVDVAVEPDLDLAEQNLQQNPLVPVEVLDAVRDTDGVAQADGTLTGPVAVLGGTKLRANGYRAIEDGPLNPFVAVEGRLPTGPGEIAVDAETGEEIARRTGSGGSGVGATIALATAVGEQQAEVVGISRFGETARRDGQPNVLVSDDDAFDWLGGGTEGFQSVLVSAAAGTDHATLADQVRDEVADSRANLVVVTGETYREERAGQAADVSDAVGIALQIFAYVALFVGIFIIYNTFTIVVTQRQRELALLRAVGASAQQVRRAVLFESLIVGVVASVIGYLVGLATVIILGKAFPGLLSFGSSDDITLGIGVIGIVQVLLSGVIVTVVSAFVPAFRAARIKPLEAMRATAVESRKPSRGRMLAGFVFGAIGLLTMLAAVGTGQGWMLAPGPFLLFLAALLLGPAMLGGWSHLIRALATRFGRPTGRIAAANIERSPRRAATTANALVIGVFLVVFATAAGGAIRDWAVSQIEQFGAADLLVGTSSPELDSHLIDQIEQIDGVTTVARVYFGFGRAELVLQGQPEPVPIPLTATKLPANASALDLNVAAGSLDDLGSDGIAIIDLQRAGGPGLGDPVNVVYEDGSRETFTVKALVDLNLFIPTVVDESVAFAHSPDLKPANIAIEVEPGRLEEVQARVEQLIEPYSSVEVLPGNAIAGFFKSFFNAIISAVNGLLAIAVVIAIFGIVNTLLLAVVERTRELGLLRAVGMARSQVRATIRVEALLISVAGTVIGMACGLFVAYTVTLVILEEQGGGFSWPGRELALIAVLGVIVGIVASVIPAHRAAKLGILESIAYE